MLKVRRAIESDRLPVFKMCVYMHQETDFRHFELDPEKLLDGVGAWIHNSVLFVVEDDDKPVGMLAAAIKETWFGPESFASEELFYVIPEYRGTRAAFLLMKAYMSWAEEQGIKHIRAGVATGGAPGAERLYEHFGMQRMGGNYVAHLTRS